MRLFFGLELPADAILQISDWRDRSLHCDGRPVPPENFHITLAFVGEVNSRKLESLLDSADDVFTSSTVGDYQLQLDQPGYWPKPGIFWLGSSAVPPSLTALAKRLRSVAAANGGKLENKAFVPHVTLYRRCTSPPPAPPSVPRLKLTWEHFTLFESVQGRQGVHYQPMAHWTLA